MMMIDDDDDDDDGLPGGVLLPCTNRTLHVLVGGLRDDPSLGI